VFVEKPLCLLESELDEIAALQKDHQHFVMVGFNRRFAPLIQKLKTQLVPNQPLAINYRINSGTIVADHWVHDKAIGGGRIIGEVCHFIDLVSFLSGSKISSISANEMVNANNLRDTLVINLKMQNGSIASISYFSNGSKELSKEYLEVFSNGQSFILNDFKSLTIHGKSSKTINLSNQDKGHKEEVKQFLDAIKKGLPCPISFDETYNAMRSTFKVVESIAKNGEQISI
jgi:predicted dehydrogenase